LPNATPRSAWAAIFRVALGMGVIAAIVYSLGITSLVSTAVTLALAALALLALIAVFWAIIQETVRCLRDKSYRTRKGDFVF
jgi:uncharacterized membrane protein YhaH (DUF805 family)